MSKQQHGGGHDPHQSTQPTAAQEKHTSIPGQQTSGQDRQEVDSKVAHESHHVGGTRSPDAADNVPRSEEAKNQEATSQQSRALSGTTAPSKV